MAHSIDMTGKWLEKDHAQRLASSVRNGAKLTFQYRANRDWVAKLAGKQDCHKSSIRNQSLDPRYVVETSYLPDKGLANDRSFYGTLYLLELDRLSW